MTRLLTYLYGALCAGILLTVSSCNDIDEHAGTLPGAEGKVRIEMFTRLQDFDVPVSRAKADENGLDVTPWVLIFRDESAAQNGQADAAMFVEAVKTVEMADIDKRYVWLEHQTKRCWALLLANPQDRFFTNATTGYTFSEENLNNLLAGKTLAGATAMLLTEPLPATVTSMPFVGARMPMSYLHPMPGGVNRDATIGSSTTPLSLVRIPAKVIVRSTAPRFTLDAVVQVGNVGGQSRLHNLAAEPPAPGTRVDYIPASGDLITPETVGNTQTTASDPIYMYETPNGLDNYGYIIVKGRYRMYVGTTNETLYTSYYKLGFVDSEGQFMDIRRNHEYTFSIKEVRGIGYPSPEDAIAGPVSNNVDYEVLITDTDSYEIWANSDYYVALSNSKTLIYAEPKYVTEKIFHVATIITNNTTDLPSLWLTPSGSTGLIEPSDWKVPTAENKNTPSRQEIWVEMWGDYGRINIQIGDLQTEWFIEIVRQDPLPWQGASLATIGWGWGPYQYHYWNTNTSSEDFTYYMLSGEVDNPADNPADWIQLSTGDNVFREKPQSIMVDDGKIHMHVEENTTGAERQATAMFTAVRNPGWDNPNASGTYRVKFIMHQPSGP